MKSIKTCGIAMLLGLFALTSSVGAANVQDLLRETQRTDTGNGQISLIWWIPPQFWDESLKASAALPEALRTQIVTTMADYTVVALLRASTGVGGLTDVQPKEELLKNTRLEVGGKAVEPLSADQVSPAAALMLTQLKPMLAATAGQVGQGMEFVVYPGKVDGKTLIDVAQPGNLTITFYGKSYQWRLPLGSLLPPKVDGKTGEQFPGNYEYNPFTGKKLDSK